jgi:hypothetical protein
VRYVLRHDGSLGWRSAQERFCIVGCADDVIGETARHVEGRVCELGNIIGEMNLLRTR